MALLRPRRRWFQFSLLSLLIFTTLAALLVARFVVPAQRQHHAVEQLTKLGGQVFYDYGLSGAQTPPGPAWLRGLIGNDFFQTVTTVQLLGDKFNSPEELHAALAQVTRMPTVTCLVVWSDGGLDAGNIQEISQLRSLRILYLDSVDANLTEAAMAPLTQLSNLARLNTGGSFAKIGLKHLSKLNQLTDLTIRNVTDDALAQIADMRHLQRLTIEGTISPDALTMLEPLVELQAISYNFGRAADRLNYPINIHYPDCSVPDVIDYFHQKTDVPFRMDMEAINRKKSQVLTEIASDVASGITLREALDRLLAPHGLDFRIEKETLVITTREEADRARAGIEALQKKLPKLKGITGW